MESVNELMDKVEELKSEMKLLLDTFTEETGLVVDPDTSAKYDRENKSYYVQLHIENPF